MNTAFLVQVIILSPFFFAANKLAGYGLQDFFKKNPEYSNYKLTIEYGATLLCLLMLGIVGVFNPS